jgi:hypothetical protein
MMDGEPRVPERTYRRKEHVKSSEVLQMPSFAGVVMEEK